MSYLMAKLSPNEKPFMPLFWELADENFVRNINQTNAY